MTPIEIRVKSLELAAKITEYPYVSNYIEAAQRIEMYILEKQE